MTPDALRGRRLSAAEWNQWAETVPPGAVSLAESAFFERAVAPRAGMTAVDLACGTGRWTRRLADWGLSVTGYDFADEALRRAEAAAPRAGVSYALWDIVADPIPGQLAPGAFDVVTCRHGLPFLEPGRLLTDVGRWLKPDGVFYALVRVNGRVDRDAIAPRTRDKDPADPVSFDLGIEEDQLSTIGAGWRRYEVHHLGGGDHTIVLSGYDDPRSPRSPAVDTPAPSPIRPPDHAFGAWPLPREVHPADGRAHGDTWTTRSTDVHSRARS